jgi:hypothetical protein
MGSRVDYVGTNYFAGPVLGTGAGSYTFNGLHVGIDGLTGGHSLWFSDSPIATTPQTFGMIYVSRSPVGAPMSIFAGSNMNTVISGTGPTAPANPVLIQDNNIFASGSGISNLNASALVIGTVPDARLSSQVTKSGNIFNGALQLLQLDSAGKIPALDGSQITGLNASALGSGIIPAARIDRTNTTHYVSSGTGASFNVLTTNGTPLVAVSNSVISLNTNVAINAQLNVSGAQTNAGVIAASSFIGPLLGNSTGATNDDLGNKISSQFAASTNYTVVATNTIAGYARTLASASTNYTITATNDSASYARTLADASTNYTVTATNSITATWLTNRLSQLVGTNIFTTAAMAYLEGLRVAAVTTNSTFYVSGAAGAQFQILATNGVQLVGITNNLITFNTNTVVNGLFTINSPSNTDWNINQHSTGWMNIDGTETNSSILNGLIKADANGGRSAISIASVVATGSYITNLYGFGTNIFLYGTNQFGTNANGGITVADGFGNLSHFSTNDTYVQFNTWGTNGAPMLMQLLGSNTLVNFGAELRAINSNTNSTNAFYFVGATTNFYQGLIQNTNALGSGDLVVAADNANDSQYYIDLGINNSKYNNNFVGYTNDGYLYVQGGPTNAGPGGNLWIGTTTTNTVISFITQGGAIGTITNLQISPTNITIPVGTILLDKTAATFAGITNTPFNAVGWVTNDANGKLYTSADVPNAALHNSTIGISGTANQITSSTATPALGGSTTLSIPSVFTAPGTIAAVTGFTNQGWSTPGVMTNDDKGKFFSTATLPSTLITSGLAVYGGSSGPITLPVSGTYWMAPNNSFTNAAADASGVTRCTIPAAGTLANLYVTASANPGAVANTVTIMTNGVSTGITCTLNNVTTGNDTTHAVAVLAGTEVGIKVVTLAGTAVKWNWGFQLK